MPAQPISPKPNRALVLGERPLYALEAGFILVSVTCDTASKWQSPRKMIYVIVSYTYDQKDMWAVRQFREISVVVN